MKSLLAFQWKAILSFLLNSFIVKHLLEHVEENSKDLRGSHTQALDT